MSTINHENDPRLFSSWLTTALTSIGYQVTIGNIKRYRFDAPVYVNGVCIGQLGPCYSEFRNGTLITRLRREQYNRELDERNRISHENRDKPWLPDLDE